MDGYPSGSLDHNVPFLIVSGLTPTKPDPSLPANLKDQAILLRSEQPSLDNREAKLLNQYFGEIDEHGKSWAAVKRDEPYRFRIKMVGRSYLLPPRHAHLPEPDEIPHSAMALHSPFSPLSPVFSIYPDGLIDAQWMKKHQELVPSIFLCFYTITSDPTTTTLQDNHLKNDIAALRVALARSGYKTRLAVALLSDDDSTPATVSNGLQDRLELIRKGAGLDPKSIFYVPPQESPAELKNVADNILAALYPTAMEYYRDLGRHAKKKRSRGVAPQPTVPPTTGTSRTLSLPDWNFRYDFKCAMFAEFRQEQDTAIRAYEQAYEELLSQDVLDAIPSWSPRWNEARILADAIAIRCLRLHFWTGQTSIAVRKWQAHRDRIADFVDRRGHGTQNYGWHAWEARWARVMADLMGRCEIPGLAPSTTALYLPPEKSMAGGYVQPWEMLHHKGYWYRIAARHLAARRTLAHAIPDEDREPPSKLPASKVTKKTYGYDTFLCPEPYEEYPLSGEGVNHASLIADCLVLAQAEFQSRKQLRIAAELSLECGKELATLKSWKEVLLVLRPVWEDLSFRSEGWLDVAEDLCWLMRRAAVEEGRGDLVVAIDWELMNKKFTRRPNWHYDLTKSIDSVKVNEKPSVILTDDELTSFITATFSFKNKESKAGESCKAQLTLISEAFAGSVPVVLSSLRVEFDGPLRPIVLDHTESEDVNEGQIFMSTVALNEDFGDSGSELPVMLSGESDLTLRPGQVRVIELAIPLRESGEVSAKALEVLYDIEALELEYTMKLGGRNKPIGWYKKGDKTPKLARADQHMLQVQPRPPKLDMKILSSLGPYYTNEPIDLKMQVLNAEDETANIKIDVHLFGQAAPPFKIRFNEDEQQNDEEADESRIIGFNIGSLDSSSSLELALRIDPANEPATYDLHVRASYHLESDAATPIMQTLPVQINIVSAFEANYDLVPRFHQDPWPSLFDSDTVSGHDDSDEGAAVLARGLAQNWRLVCHYASFASEDLRVVGMEMKVLSATPTARTSVFQQPEVPAGGISVTPKTMQEAFFDLTAQKLSLDDRQPVPVDLAFVIHWQRLSGKTTNMTVMPAGHYLLLGSEPRVLATMLSSGVSEQLKLQVTIENPSSHFLTFGLSMDPSDEFAFSGAKTTTVHLLPMSRRTVTYRLLPLVSGCWVRPGLTVKDKYFQKVLRVIATEGMKMDKEGFLIWIPAMVDENETDTE